MNRFFDLSERLITILYCWNVVRNKGWLILHDIISCVIMKLWFTIDASKYLIMLIQWVSNQMYHPYKKIPNNIENLAINGYLIMPKYIIILEHVSANKSNRAHPSQQSRYTYFDLEINATSIDYQNNTISLIKPNQRLTYLQSQDHNSRTFSFSKVLPPTHNQQNVY